jgi:hypothetical protein
MEFPLLVARNLSGYYPTLDRHLRLSSKYLSESIPQPTPGEQLNELLSKYKIDARETLNWMKSLSKQDLILNMSSIVHAFRPPIGADIRTKIIYGLSRKTYPLRLLIDRIGMIEDFISIIGQLKSWEDLELIDKKIDTCNSISSLFFEVYILDSCNMLAIKTWIISSHSNSVWGNPHEDIFDGKCISFFTNKWVDRLLSLINTKDELDKMIIHLGFISTYYYESIQRKKLELTN